MPPGESIADRLNQYLDLTWGRPVNQDVKPNFINSDPNTSPFYRTTIAGPAMTYGCDVASGIMTDIGSKDLYGKVGAFEAYAPKIAYFYPVFQKITSDYKQSRLSSEINSSTTPLLTGSPFFMDPVQINYKYTNSLSPVFGRKIYNDNENCEKLANILFKMGNIETIYSPITIEYLPMFEHIQAGSDKNTSFDENGMRYPHNYCGIFNTLTFNIYDQNYRIKDGKSVLLEKYSNYPLSHINIWRGNRPANSVILTHNPMAHATRMFGPVYVRLPYNSLAPDLKIPFVGNLKDYEEQPYLYVALRPMVLEKNSLDFYNSPQCSDRTAEFLYEGSVLTYYPIYGAELQLFYGERPQTKDPHDDFYDLMTLIERNRNNGNMINFEFFPDHDSPTFDFNQEINNKFLYVANQNHRFTSVIGEFKVDDGGYLVFIDKMRKDDAGNPIVYDFKQKIRFVKHVVIPLNCEQALCETPLNICTQFCVRYRLPQESNPDVLPALIYTSKESTCADRVLDRIKKEIRRQYENILAGLQDDVINKYRNTCNAKVRPINDELKVTLPDQFYHHYTLYYYDRAGNLIRTVPPKGVDINIAFTRSNHPNHTLATDYFYNSIGEKIREITPDGGESWYLYNRKGQLRASQTARQRAISSMSFIDYDYNNRIVKSGQRPIPWLPSATYDDAQDWVNTNSGSYSVVGESEINEVTYTTTPTLPAPYTTAQQRNTRNRITLASYDADGAGGAEPNKTYYSYDPMGNVEWIIQDIDGMTTPNGTEKAAVMIKYHYDLISGKVNRLDYRPGFPDQFYHKYNYDKDNRLTQVWTSRDTVIWEQDAIHSYYKHGPSKRIVIGEDSVQGTDYVYTLHGWLKAINHPALSVSAAGPDPGADGIAPTAPPRPRTVVGRDAFGMVLNYFGTDYQSGSFGGHDAIYTPGVNLYNGNISSWSLNTLGNDPANSIGIPTANFYTYDKLDRLLFDHFVFRPTGSSWTYQNSSGKNHFGSRYSYDANGNILSLSRNGLNGGTVQKMDSLTYFYTPNTNRLSHLTDAITPSPFTEDLETQSANNYSYDASGNLIHDNAEQLDIEWNIKGKVTKVTDNSTTTQKIISFEYDANGNRVKKKVSIANGPCNDNVTTYYVYADKGTLLATYSRQECVPNTVYLDEHTLYGSKRLGVRNYPGVGQSNRVSLSNEEVPNDQILYKREIFTKHYEVSDHLGNVRAVIGDTKWDAGGGIFRPNVITYSNYYPFGMAQPGRNLNSADYKFGYNGQEKVDEISGSGNHNTAEFWEYDPRSTRRWNIDPKPNMSMSSYATFAANPIMYNDIRGDSAWKITNKWTEDYIKKYHKEIETIANLISKDGKDYTCEDFALTVAVTFARNNNLPFRFITNAKVFDASAKDYSDFSSFLYDLKLMTGAPDFQNGLNTYPISLDYIRPGDIILNRTDENRAKHVQVVTNIWSDSFYSNVTTDVDGMKFIKGINIVQGNFHKFAIRKLGSNDPESWFYYGTIPQFGFWNTETDTYSNYTTGNTTSNYSREANTTIRRFNFFKWNQ
jgi:hypothetical protein